MNARQRRKSLKRFARCAYTWARSFGDFGPKRGERDNNGAVEIDWCHGRFVISRDGRTMYAEEPKTTAGGATRYFDTVYKFNGALERRTVDGYTFRQPILTTARS